MPRPDRDAEPEFDGDMSTKWIIDQREYMGLVSVLVRARAAVAAMKPIGDGSARVPPRAVSELRGCLDVFEKIDANRRMPCPLRLVRD
jgi:hypothetical protein